MRPLPRRAGEAQSPRAGEVREKGDREGRRYENNVS